MPTRNVNLTPELDREVSSLVKSGKYDNASAVIRAGLQALKREQAQQKAALKELRKALEEGDASGLSTDYSIDNILEKAGLPKRR